ncbi:hypothetical protein BGZ97_003057 [Linnemannia gamsii]|uniref:Zn(2)-C6 fungal-type domain-containing protein n=1 Tax=Linnemannia gamsii TaxID=64522 RepID=A0A9P6QXT0_9FUNG|nr:hypothetical protein BGZ97_003057 [Linnemannia gamsii]
MASSILQLSPHQQQTDNSSSSASNHNHTQLHSEESSDPMNNNKVAYDLRRLKVYSSCLRCRTKKVKCDRKEPCSRCQKHNVECSYRELTSVQLDIRQFQRHLNNPKIRKDGAGIITSTATPVIASSSSSSSRISPSPASAATSSTITFSPAPSPPIIHYSIHNNSNNNNCPVDYSAEVIPPTTATSSNSTSPSSPSTGRSISPSFRKGKMTSESSSANSCIDAESCANLLLAVSAKNINSKTAATATTAIDRVRIHKIHRRKLSSKPTKPVPDCIFGNSSMCMELSDINDHVDKVQLSESSPSRPSPPISTSNPVSVSVSVTAPVSRRFSSDSDDIEDSNANVPIWRAQAVGKHTQTVHEQDMAETFGLAAYLKAKEMEISQDPGRAGQTIDYEKELERALAQRMPSSFSRPDRSRSRAQKNGQTAYSHATPYARPSYCQLSPSSPSSASARAGSPSNNNNSSVHAKQQPPPTAQCCCQIAAMQGQALGSCPYSNVSHGGYDSKSNSNSNPMLASPPASTRSATVEHDESTRIAYSPSYSPSYATRDTASFSESTTSSSSFALPQLKISSNWPSSTTKLPSMVTSPTSPCSPLMRMDLSSPRTELPPIRFPASAPVSIPVSASSEFEVGRDGEEPIQIDCKYNEPNVDAWDMIEKPISRTVPLTTKRGRSIKMEMGWILS